MSVDKLVDSTLLDAACTYEAGKIREKLGSSAQIAYDLANGKGFGDAIAAIPSGGTDYLGQLLAKALTSYTNSEITSITTPRTFQYQIALKSVSFPNVVSIEQSAGYLLSGCTGLTSVPASMFPNLSSIAGSNIFENCTNITVAVLPSLSHTGQNNIFMNCQALTAADLGAPSDSDTYYNFMNQNFFNGCTSLKNLILRKPVVAKLGNINNFNNTPFASGGSGGTIYIPESLYDHLGDGTSLDYKAASNWSTINGYGTITWAKIEGSQYETHYADGTPIT